MCLISMESQPYFNPPATVQEHSAADDEVSRGERLPGLGVGGAPHAEAPPQPGTGALPVVNHLVEMRTPR